MPFIIIYLLFGLVIGSFLNVVIIRLKNAESFLTGYSKCPNCQKRINWFDLIPLISYMILAGRCRYCREKISWQYPIVEAVTALLFVISYFAYGPTYDSALLIAALSLFLILVVYDLREMEVPEVISWLLIGVALIGRIILHYDQASSIIIGGLISGGVIAVLVYLSKGKWMGDGDIKIAAAIGFLLGFPLAVFGIFASFITGAIVGSVLLIIKAKKGKDLLPFTPFLLTGLVIAVLWGQQIVDWYLGRFII
jgi:leader peptidase (prepilin peptidase)/N-methyltransferase